MSLNQDLANLFARFAQIMEIRGESVFKAIAFQKVSRLLDNMTDDIRVAVEAGTLKEIEGIGGSSARIIEEFTRTGKSADFDEVATSVPAGLIPMLEISGLGPKTIALLWKQRDITSIEQLAKAIDEGKLAGLKGIGEKKIESIKQGIAMRVQASQRLGIGEALPIAESLLLQLRKLPEVKRVEIAGSLRRQRETIGDVDLICELKHEKDGDAVAAAFATLPEVHRVLGQGSTKASIVTASGLQVDLRMIPSESFGAALMYFTGSKEHNVKLRSRALDMGMTLNEWGLAKVAGKAKRSSDEAAEGKTERGEVVASRTEQDVYRALGLSFIEPEMREDRGEIEACLAGKLPRLITSKDIRGDLHCHTTASDGQASIEQMAEAAANLGYQYLGITDHSKSQVIANGLSAGRLLQHVKEIRKVAERLKGTIKLLAGCEVDILVDGRMDYEDAVLAELDFVVGSPHASLKQDEAKATDRIVRAIENKYVTIIGHPTGRLINSRAGLSLDFARVIKAAKDTGTALEINAGYPRLDLSEGPARAAAEAGVTISINTDAHSTGGLLWIDYGINVARRAWITPPSVLNCLTFDMLIQFIHRKRK